jgi:O-antigen biosynthesis protein
VQHLLIIGKVWPEPGSSAAGSRTMQLIEVFQEQAWKISFACAAGESDFVPDLERLNINKYSIQINDTAFDELLKKLAPTIVIFDRFITEEQFGWRVAENCPQALLMLDTIDLHCLRAARHLALKENREFALTDLLTIDIAKREIASIYRCDISLMVSDVEMDILQNIFQVPKVLLHYIPFLYEAINPTQIKQWLPFSERQHFISIGNFLHEPNWDAVLFLKKEIWPLIRKELPKIELHIYGAYPSQKVFELNNPKEGFLIKGRAQSAFEVMAKARLCLAPLRFGAGIKGKLSDAMLCGTPSITTSIGAESMQSNLPWNGKIADTATDFAKAACDLYNNQTEWEIASKNGATIINTVFSKKEHGVIFLNLILNTLANLKQHRLTNFTGTMLKHQNLAATKYMALWIEEKNKGSEKA